MLRWRAWPWRQWRSLTAGACVAFGRALLSSSPLRVDGLPLRRRAACRYLMVRIAARISSTAAVVDASLPGSIEKTQQNVSMGRPVNEPDCETS